MTHYDFPRVLHPTGYRDLRAIHTDITKTCGIPVADLGGVDTFAMTWRDFGRVNE
jgi:hypothetical protein